MATGEPFTFDFDRLSEKQREVFGKISIGLDHGCYHRRTLESLVRHGLIESSQETMHFSDGLPPMRVTRWFVPTYVHIAWCEWCSQNADDVL